MRERRATKRRRLNNFTCFPSGMRNTYKVMSCKLLWWLKLLMSWLVENNKNNNIMAKAEAREIPQKTKELRKRTCKERGRPLGMLML